MVAEQRRSNSRERKRALKPPSAARSRIMSSVRGRGNETTELRLARAFRKAGISGWRRHVRLPGRPDFVFARLGLAIFVDGCFWHGCPRCYLAPTRNAWFWADKVETNKRRDRRVAAALRRAGWRVIRLREHELSGGAGIPKRLRKLFPKHHRQPSE